MSELGPEYLRAMREALSSFYDEIRNFHTDQGPNPTPGSLAVNEQDAFPRPESLVTARSIATGLIESGGEHVTAFVKTITEPMNLSLAGPASVPCSNPAPWPRGFSTRASTLAPESEEYSPFGMKGWNNN